MPATTPTASTCSSAFAPPSVTQLILSGLVTIVEDRSNVDQASPPAWRRHVESLLPPIPAERHPPGYLLAFLAAVGFQLLTPAGQSHLTHLWAEDGALFLRDSLTRRFGTNLVTPYGRYLHVVPRLVAWLMSVLPLAWAPIVSA